MNTYEIEREDNVTVFFDAETIQQLEKSVMDYRIAFPTYSIKVYELDEQLKRKPNPMEYDSLSNTPDAEMEISHHKCEVLDRKKGEIKLNGIRLKNDNTLGVSKTWMTKLRGLLHAATRDDRATVEGHMALFKHVTKNREMTSTEQKIADAYSKYAEQFIYKKKSCLPAYVTPYNQSLDFGPGPNLKFFIFQKGDCYAKSQ